MAVSRVVLFLGLLLAALMAVASSQSTAPAPAPTSDGTSLDQAVAFQYHTVVDLAAVATSSE
ncbi:unnamed protein product [Sphenostylis stenocarpa]|uniref:Uncharacterized protein n=1 Tax=Sphenostylis stenocarpa TaxID=92480 RepID=A0AA86STE1_9FABA|nr:unnamed protein product [Sphenostylis stenocarpa]